MLKAFVTPVACKIFLALGLFVLPASGSAQSELTLPDLETIERASPLENLTRDELHREIRAYLLDNPEVLVEAMQVLEERRLVREEETARMMVSQLSDEIFDDGYSYIGGNPEGSVTVVEFHDYRCGFCKRAHSEVAELVATDDDIRLVIKELPILGPDSNTTSRFAIATKISQGPEAYKRISDAMMTYGGPINDAALDRLARTANIDADATRQAIDDPRIEERIAQTLQLARQLEVNGTPTFVIGNTIVRGYIPLEEMRSVVEISRNEAG